MKIDHIFGVWTILVLMLVAQFTNNPPSTITMVLLALSSFLSYSKKGSLYSFWGNTISTTNAYAIVGIYQVAFQKIENPFGVAILQQAEKISQCIGFALLQHGDAIEQYFGVSVIQRVSEIEQAVGIAVQQKAVVINQFIGFALHQEAEVVDQRFGITLYRSAKTMVPHFFDICLFYRNTEE